MPVRPGPPWLGRVPPRHDGLQRLRELGYDPTSFPLATGVFEVRDCLPLVERLGMLVFLDESSAFGYKHGSRKGFQGEGDAASVEYMMYDICDETRHVANGHHRITHVQAAVGDTRSHDHLFAGLRRLLQERVAYIGTGYKDCKGLGRAGRIVEERR